MITHRHSLLPIAHALVLSCSSCCPLLHSQPAITVILRLNLIFPFPKNHSFNKFLKANSNSNSNSNSNYYYV